MSAVEEIIATAQDIANTHSSEVSDAVNQALGIAGGSTSSFFPSLAFPSPDTPKEQHVKDGQSIGAYIPSSVSAMEIYDRYDTTEAQIRATATAAIANFLITYFPNSSAFTAAETWLEQTISSGGANFTSVENQFWANARNRSAQEEQRALRRLADEFQGDFPAPPGAYAQAYRETMLEFKRTREERNNEVAIQHIDRALDLIKDATAKAISLRTQAINLALDYMKGLMEPADIASRLVIPAQGQQAALINAIGNYYKDMLARDELVLDAAYKKALIEKEYTAIGIDLQKVDIHSRTNAAIGAAQAAADTAKGALSSLNAVASYAQSV